MERKVEKFKHMKLKVIQPMIRINFQHVDKPYRISPHEVLQS